MVGGGGGGGYLWPVSGGGRRRIMEREWNEKEEGGWNEFKGMRFFV